MKLFSTLYDRMLLWGQHRHAPAYLMGLSFLEAFFFPIPPDVMLAPMSLSNPHRAFSYAALATISSVMGGVVGYFIGTFFVEWLSPYMVELGYQSAYLTVQNWFMKWGFLSLFFAGLVPIPYKLFSIASGAAKMSLLPFIVGSLVGRGARFYLVSALMRLGGEKMRNFLRLYVDRLSWVVLTLVIVALAFFLCSCKTVEKNYAPVINAWEDPSAIRSCYRVQKKDTLYSIAWAFDLDYRDLAAANHLSSPYTLRPGQTLCMSKRSTVETTPSIAKTVATYPLRSQVCADRYEEVACRVKESRAEVCKEEAIPEPCPGLPSLAAELCLPQIDLRAVDRHLAEQPCSPCEIELPEAKIPSNFPLPQCTAGRAGRWPWPANGKIVKEFSLEPGGCKGLDIAGQLGDSIRAVAPGKVVYCGSGLRGYGNLIIIKHSDNYLSAYAHNQLLLVKEGQQVLAGSEIAKMGQNDAGNVILHFEIRRNGKPMNPRLYL